MAGWLEDLRYAVRSALKRPGRSLVVCCGLALGLGANVAVWSYLDFLLWAELPAREPARLVAVDATADGSPGAFSYPDYLAYRDRNQVLSELAAAGSFSTTVDTGSATVHAWGDLVSGNFFNLLGVAPRQGRTLTPADDRSGAEPAAVLSAPFWRRAFAADPQVLGRTVRLNGHPVRIVGLMPEHFLGTGFPVDFYLPIVQEDLVRANVNGRVGDRRAAWLYLWGRLRPGVRMGQAQAALSALAMGLDQADPRPGAPRRMRVTPGGRVIDPVTRAALLPAVRRILLFVGLLLVLACANVANLLLANAVDRRHDLALRVALGAGRWRLVRQMLAESLLLALLGGAAGLWLGIQGIHLIEHTLHTASGSTGLGSWGEGLIHLRLDFRVLSFSLLLCLAAGLLSGLLPALRATSRRRLLSSYRGDTGGGAEEPGGPLGRFGTEALLVVLQVAMSTWLLAGTAFLAESVWRIERTPMGFDAANVLLVTCALPAGLEGNSPRQARTLEEIADSVRTLPGIQSVSLSWGVPLAGWSHSEKIEVPERRGQPLSRNLAVVGLDYFETLKIPRLAGRGFERRDADGAPRVAIVNQALAAELWPGRSALGRRLLLPGKAGAQAASVTSAEVIGVAADTRAVKLWERPAPLLYLPLAQNPHRLMTLLVRPAGAAEPAGLQPALRRELRRTHPELAVVDVVPFALHLERSLWNQRMNAQFLAVFGALGLALAGLGLGSAMSFSVSRRQREIGVRMALGSTPGGVQSLVLRWALTQVALGVALGLAATLAFIRLLAGLIEGTETTADPLALLGATLVLFTVGLAATWAPARRAARIDPCDAFRAE
ncbi:MAG TPA: ADOP family duplicated permease [Thermoanaerobaculia bacterium]|nr:ADOP family duplicated permease [Thermoanaerobaculia bacterium]